MYLLKALEGYCVLQLRSRSMNAVRSPHPRHQLNSGAINFSRSVTSSSDMDGWSAQVLSKSCLVAPILIAIATAWMISGASGPTIERSIPVSRANATKALISSGSIGTFSTFFSSIERGDGQTWCRNTENALKRKRGTSTFQNTKNY